jgi:NAD(P)-dependent dehydrogenase (short-subunit alcohol dehydrogenase family)
MELEGSVALITGAARGLGAELGRTLGGAGAVVVLTDIREGLLQATADKLREEGWPIMALTLDVADEGQAQEVVSQIMATYGRLDILINNAAIDRTESIEELEINEWERILRTNLRGPFVLSKMVFPAMKARRSGHVVNIVSTAAKRAWANASAYHASKWGLLGFSHALHVEARPYQIKVTAVVSGGMRTPFLLERFPDIDLNTLQDPRNVAETIRWLLTLPPETVVPEITVIPMRETSWP